MMHYYVYLLKSLKTGKYYIGSSYNPEKRIIDHNKGKTKSTKSYRPWKLLYIEKYQTKKEACKREWHLKHTKGYKDKLFILKTIGRVA